MRIRDLTRQYIDYVNGAIDRDAYLDSFPQLFDHYFRFWSDRKRPLAELAENDVKTQAEMIRIRLPVIEERFARIGFDLSDLPLILFVGHNTSNGHAARIDDTFQVWLPVETYTSEKLIDIFVAHEIAHALHYKETQSFYFESPSERHHIGRQLLTEGTATYVTGKVWDVAESTMLWADYLPVDKCQEWLESCRERASELCQFVENNFQRSERDCGIFVAVNPEDPFFYRAGYWVGLRLAETMVRDWSLSVHGLLACDRGRFEDYALSFLKRAAADPAMFDR